MYECSGLREDDVTENACCPILDAPLSDADAETTASIFKALGDPTRVKLLSLVASSPTGEACVCELVVPLGLSQPTVSHHLKLLVGAGLLERERRGTWAYYRVDESALARAGEALTSGRRVRIEA